MMSAAAVAVATTAHEVRVTASMVVRGECRLDLPATG
jgi:hypothetical protein